MDHDVLAAIARLRATWDEHVEPSARRALIAAAAVVLFAAAHVARVGVPAARVAAGAALFAAAAGLAARAIVARTRRRDVRHAVRSTLGRTDPDLGAATLRALRLAERARADASVGSPELAALHLGRVVARARHDRIEEHAAALAKTWSAAGIALALLASAVVLVEPFRIVEGLDVLVARRGEAPLPLGWLDRVEMVARPPEYLHEGERVVLPFSPTAQPRGTVVTVRGRPLHAGRRLVLTDGTTDVPFVDDGAGGVVARYTVADSTSVFVAARFGAVRIRQADQQVVESIADRSPKVTVEGAPRTVRLVDEPNVSIRYEATDDHGLREVSLVLRGGTREERRVLSRPATDATSDGGGYELRSSDPFFRRTYVPVEVTVEARDNDPISGPKWGKSAAIVIVPPQVGEPEALRYQALVRARDALTDLLADRMVQKAPSLRERSEHVRHEEQAQRAALDTVREVVGDTYGGLRVTGPTASLLRGQLRRLGKALAVERENASAATHRKLLEETESALLAFDSGVRGRGYRDTKTVARRLADVADEAGDAAALAISGGAPGDAKARLDAATLVLDGGGKQLLRLGELGLDLGEIVANGIRRIHRARDAGDMVHAELAARDLAARLRRPESSFSGGGGRGGVESGGPGGSGPGEPSEADGEMAQLDQELERLSRDHAGQIEAVEQALERAIPDEDVEALREAAKRHAEAIRKAVEGLPSQGGDPGTAAESAATAREQAEAMAGALESGKPREAVESGRGASSSLRDAQRRADQSGGIEGPTGREAAKARETIERELAWAEDAIEKLGRAGQDRAKPGLENASKAEQGLAERAKGLSRRGQQGESSMPEDVLQSLGEAEEEMRRAQKELGDGRGETGLEHQRTAQRLLEMARGERHEDGERGEHEGEGGERGESPDGPRLAQEAKIPGKEAHKTPEDFRRRVLRGLGSSQDPALREAVRRYAEGLLK